MFKKAAKWIAKKILWPLLREVLVESLRQLARYAIDRVKQLIAKWKEDEIKEASSESEKEAVRKKYESRSQDLEDAKEDISSKIGDIVEQAMDRAESERDRLLKGEHEKDKQLSEGEGINEVS
jgi:exonuclease VII large subunit